MSRPDSSRDLGFIYGTALTFLAVGLVLGAVVAAALGWRL